ncbi:MAG TPA: hypothetical protein VHQ20_00145 [Patescibacteria group bacterium]|nr:hypothetical protein [Patescibacteria group bacterium]
MKTAQAHEVGGEAGGIQALMHIDPNDHPFINSPAKFHFSFTDPDVLFKIQNCNCTIFLFKGENIIDQHVVTDAGPDQPTLTAPDLYTHTFTEPGDYSIHFVGQPKKGTQFDDFALHFDVHVYASEAEANTAATAEALANHNSNSNSINTNEHTEHVDDHSWQHLLSAHHLGHGIIFGGGFVAAIILYVYGVYEKRKLKKIKEENNSK